MKKKIELLTFGAAIILILVATFAFSEQTISSTGIVNELVLTNLNDDPGNITIFGYNTATQHYDSLWTTDTSDVTLTNAGGVIGDITHDGQLDFVLARYDGKWGLDVWTYNSTSDSWYRVWDGDFGSRKSNLPIYITDIGDFDNDGFSEMLLVNRLTSAIEVYGNDVVNAATFSLSATIKSSCGNYLALSSGDLNANGILEIVLQCGGNGKVMIFEWNGATYSSVANVTIGATIMVDQIDCSGDVNRDTYDDCILCGNFGHSKVLTYAGGSYTFAYNSSQSLGYTQTCGIADLTNDGYPDWYDVSRGPRIFSYDGSNYYSVWNSSINWGEDIGIGESGAGDSDNDGKGELFVGNFTYSVLRGVVFMWENDTSNSATTFANTLTWGPVDVASANSPNMIIGNLNPYNDNPVNFSYNCLDTDSDTYFWYDAVLCSMGNDCNDNNVAINPGAAEVCGDSIDNNCNNEVDEGCVVLPVCGDGYCDGLAYSENCNTCSADCWSGGSRGACCGDGKCDTRKGETAAVCPVDC